MLDDANQISTRTALVSQSPTTDAATVPQRKGTWMPTPIEDAKDLCWSAKRLLVEIDSLHGLGSCWASNRHFAQLLKLSPDRVSRLVTDLRKKGYIKVEMTYKPGTKQVDKRYITPIPSRWQDQYPLGNDTDTPSASSPTPLPVQTPNPPGPNTKDTNTAINAYITNTSEGDASAWSDEMSSVLSDWINYKAERKEKYGDVGLKALMGMVQANIVAYGETAVIALIHECMASGYQGILWDRLERRKSTQANTATSFADRSYGADARMVKDIAWLAQFAVEHPDR